MGDLLQRLALVFIQQGGLWSWRGGGAAPAAGDRASRGPTAYRSVRERKRGPGGILPRLELGRCVMQMC